MVEKLFPDPFLKTQNQVYLWVNNLKFYTVCFYCMLGSGLSKYIETKLQTTCFYLIRSFFKNKKRSGTSFPVSFSAWFLKKNISFIMCYCLTKYCLVVFTLWDNGKYVYCNCFLTRLWRHKFWNQLYLSNQAVFSTLPESQGNNSNILRTTKAFEMKYKNFFTIFKGV